MCTPLPAFEESLTDGEGGEFDDFATLQGGFVGAEAYAGPVGALAGIRKGITIVDQRGDELMNEMRMGPAMPRSLGEGTRFRAASGGRAGRWPRSV